jgi:type I restriction enzyme M protein
MTDSKTVSDWWDLFERLRNEPHPPSAYVAPLAAMLFLRWADFQEAEAEAMAAFDETEYRPLLPATLHWRRWHELPPGELPGFLNQTLPEAIDRLRSTHDPLAGSLRRVVPAIRSAGQLSVPAIGTLTEWLAAQAFETPNDRRQLLQVFDDILDRASERHSGQFRTPACIDDLLVALAAPVAGERLYDPCFGFGGILTAAWRQVQEAEPPGWARRTGSELAVAGVEVNPQAFAVGLARLALEGVANPQLELGDSLERESATNPQKEGFDLVVCDPPWGGRIDPCGLDHFPIKTNDSTGLFIQHALSQLRSDGRAVIVVPHGLLFQRGANAKLRRWLLENHRVDAVIGMPEGVFLPYTGIKAAIMFVRRNGGPTERIRMVDGAAFFEPRKGKVPSVILSKGIEALVKAVRDIVPGESAWDVEAGTIAELDLDLMPVRRDKPALERTLETIGHEVPVLPLKEICRIGGGSSVSAARLLDHPTGEDPVPYVRISDVQRGQAGKAALWLKSEAAADLGSRPRLRAGEVLLSRSGTIGKAGVVRNGAVGGVASGGLLVLRPDTMRIDPHFLAAYLACRDCVAWLESKAGGSVMKTLRTKYVEDLPVPVPPLPVQHRIASDVREHQVDALTQLRLLVTEDPEDLRLARWIDRSLRRLTEVSSTEGGGASDVVRFRVFGHEFETIRGQATAENERSLLNAWILGLNEVADLFRGTELVPEGPALLSILQEGVRRLATTAKLLEGESPLESKAMELTLGCIVRLGESIQSLMGDVRVVIRVGTDTLPVGARTEVSFVVKNEGRLPLRNFMIEARDWFPALAPIFLPEHDEETLVVELNTPTEPGKHQMLIEWSGVGLDGRQHQGKQKIAFEIEASIVSEAAMDLGLSPYFISQPVGPDRGDVFFGREEVIDQIKRQIQSGNAVLLEGNRRAGKSSIIKHLEGADGIPGWLAVYSSFQAATGDDRSVGYADRDGLAHAGSEHRRRVASSGEGCPPAGRHGLEAGGRRGHRPGLPQGDQ